MVAVALLLGAPVRAKEVSLPDFLDKVTYIERSVTEAKDNWTELLQELSVLRGLAENKELMLGLFYKLLSAEIAKQVAIREEHTERKLLLFDKTLNKAGNIRLQVYERQNSEGIRGKTTKTIEIKSEF